MREQYAYRPTERAMAGKRHDEWTATGTTEVECVLQIGRCLRAPREGRWPD